MKGIAARGHDACLPIMQELAGFVSDDEKAFGIRQLGAEFR